MAQQFDSFIKLCLLVCLAGSFITCTAVQQAVDIEPAGANDAKTSSSSGDRETQTPVAARADGMLAQWSFNEGSGERTRDEVQGLEATAVNTRWERRITSPAADTRAALEFDGNQAYVDTGVNSVELGIDNQATFTAWINMKDLDANDRADIISDWDGSGTDSGDGITLRVWPSGGVEFYAYPGNHRATSDDGVIQENTWHLIAGVIDGDAVYVYVDGERVGEADFAGTIGDSGTSLKIGTRGNKSSVSYTSAFIDDVRVYDRALSADELGVGSRSTASNIGKSMLAQWAFNEGSGERTRDEVQGLEATVVDTRWERRNTSPAADTRAALEFDGDQAYVDTGVNCVELGIDNQATFTAWINMKDLDANDRADIISDWDGSGTDSGDGITLRVWPSGGVEFYAYPGNHRATSDDGVIQENTWHLIAGVIDGDAIYAYVDGERVGEADFAGTIGDSGTSLKIGTRGNKSSVSYASAFIDDVRVYSRALSADEFHSIMEF